MRYGLVYGLGFLLLLGGIWMAMEAGKQADRELREDILHSVVHIANAINPKQVRALTFTGEDSENPVFLRLRSQLKAYAQVTGLRSLYTMALRDGKIVFGPESIEPGGPGASLPGTVYENPAPEDFEIFKTGQTNVQGPRTDEYGSFVSALAPVKDPRTGEVLMAVGIDVETPLWYARIIRARMLPLQILMLILVILAASVLALRFRKRYKVRRYPALIHIETVLCALLMLMATAVAAVLIHNAEKRARSEAFTILAHARTTAHINAFDYLSNELNMLVSFFESSDHINRAEFRSYCEPLIESRIIQACGWAPAVKPAGADGIVAAARADGLEEFTIWQNGTAGTPESSTGRDICYPMLYVEPQAAHKDILGYDLRSDDARWPAVENAVLTGIPTATEPAILFAITNRPQGFVVYQSASNALQQGVALLALLPGALMQSGISQHIGEHGNIAVSLFHLPAGRPPVWLACSEGCSSSHDWQQLSTELHQCVPLFAFNQTFALLAFPGPQWHAANPLRMGMLASFAGLTLTVLLTTLVGSAAGRQAGLEKAIEERSTELVESERRFSGLFRHMSTGFALHEMIYDLNGKPLDYRFLEINPAFEQLTGLNADQVVGKTALEVLPQTEREWIDRYGRVTLTGHAEQFEMYASSLNKYFSVTAYCPAPGQFATIFEDITDRRKTEQAMRHLQSIVMDSPAVAYRFRAEPGWPIEYVSDNIRQMGYSPEDFYSGRMDIAGLIEPEDMERVAREMEDISRNPEITQFIQIYRVRAADGRIRWVRDSSRINRDASGRVINYQGVALDITAQREAETQMEHLQQIIMDSPAVAFLWRAEPGWPVEYVSGNIRQFGYAPEDIYAGHVPFSDMVDPADLPRVIEEVTRYSSDPATKEYVQQYGLRTKDGRTRWVRDATRLRRDETGKITHYEGVILDITEQHEAELALAESRRQLEALLKERTTELKISNEARKIFLATMSHELHTPLNAIIGFAEALQENIYGKLQTGQTEPLEHIQASAWRLNSLIDDLINISRIEGGVMPFHADALPIRHVLEESALLLQAAARNRKQKLTTDFHSVPDRLRIRADLVKIKQIMHHLISNAIKFTQEGGQIEVSGRIVEGSEFGLPGRCLRVEVKDNGRGLEPEEKARVFDLFYQADSTLARAHGGTGLGLPIVKEFIKLHGGRTWVESGGPGRGCVFTFVIPAEPCAIS